MATGIDSGLKKKQTTQISQSPNSYRTRIIMMIMITAAIVILVVALAASVQNGFEFLDQNIISLNSGWTDDQGKEITLPTKFEYQLETYCISKEVPVGNGTPRYMLFYAKYENVHIFYNDVEIASCICKTQEQTRTQGKIYTMTLLPQEAGVLRLEIDPLLGDNIAYEIVVPQIGTGSGLIQTTIEKDLVKMVITSLIFCFGLFLLVCGLQVFRTLKRGRVRHTIQISFLHIGVFAIIFSLYVFLVTDSIQFFLNKPYFIYVAEFLLMALIPMPLLALIAEECTPRFQRLLILVNSAIFLNFTVIVLLHIFLKVELRSCILSTHILLALCVIILFVSLISVGLKKDGTWWPMIAFSPLLIGGSIDIGRYYFSPFYQRTEGFYAGVLVFLLLQTISFLNQNLANYETYLLASTYEQMAYTDVMTGIANRASYEEMVENIKENPQKYDSIWCISADINNLKQVNDTLGHNQGDELIKGAAKILSKIAENKGVVYRIGGDEFIVLLFNLEEKTIKSLCRIIAEEMTIFSDTHPYELSIAVGYENFKYTEGDTVEGFISRADAMMYKKKRKWKETHEEDKV